MAKFRSLLRPMDKGQLEELARKSAQITRQQFGRTIRLFAPLYLSNECVNNCLTVGSPEITHP